MKTATKLIIAGATFKVAKRAFNAKQTADHRRELNLHQSRQPKKPHVSAWRGMGAAY